METIAGLADGRPGHADGVGAAASFCNPRQLSMRDKHTLLIADSGSHKIRQIDLRTGAFFAGGTLAHCHSGTRCQFVRLLHGLLEECVLTTKCCLLARVHENAPHAHIAQAW